MNKKVYIINKYHNMFWWNALLVDKIALRRLTKKTPENYIYKCHEPIKGYESYEGNFQYSEVGKVRI